MPFVHLHTHTHYSILEGLGSPERYVKRAQELSQEALAITDHGNLYGAIEFYKYAKKADIHPVIGVEFWMAIDKRTDRRPKIDNRAHNLILLAENQNGYENLIQLVTRSHLEGFYFRPRIDWELLEEYRNGLICLTSDLKGLLSHFLLAGKQEEAIATLNRLQKIYGKENVFVELEDHPKIDNQATVNELLVELAKSCSAPLVATNDVHYPTQEDNKAQDVLLCIKENKHIDDVHRWRYMDDYSFKSSIEMSKSFEKFPESISNTLEIAKRCHVDFKFGVNLIPHFPTPKKKSSKEYLHELVSEGLIERYKISCTKENILENNTESLPKNESKIVDRMNFELNTVHEMGFDEYFLIVWDFIRYAKEKNIYVGPGRGSAAGSIIAYCLKITDLDPIKYGLLFERFLNPARVSMPDIDIDFEDDRRDEILDYVADKYGRDRVAQVITFGTLAAKASVKDVGRVFGVPFQEMNQLTKLIPSRPGTKLADALESEPELIQEYENNSFFQKIYDTALKLEGTIRQTGVHACAVVISRDSLTKYTPLQKAPGDSEAIITQFSMKPLENLGLLKMDFLGLRNLTILKKTLSIIEHIHGIKINLENIPMDDKKTFALLSEGKTTGVFQLESAGMKRYLKDLKPSAFDDVIAMGALYRPGPMQFIPDYIAGKNGTRKVKYVHDDLKAIIDKTYGIAVYQEQILQIAQKFAGFSLGEADLLRRAIGKKIAHELMAQREKFIEGAVAQGYDKQLAMDIFDKVIEPFANYGFNKSHAACYGLISYQTAYLKAHYPSEFMAALLSSDQDNTDRVVIDIRECEEMGILILPPNINQSDISFFVTDDMVIRYGLSAIKNLGKDTIEHILVARKDGGLFKDLADLIHRLPSKCVNKKSFEALIMSGALDDFGDRNALMCSIETITHYAKQYGKGQQGDQTDLFSLLSEKHGEEHPIQLTNVDVASWFQKLKWEKESLGLYISDHPLRGLRKYMQRKVTLIGHIKASMSGREITVGGLVNDFRKITTKRGELMAVLDLEDLTGSISVVIFPGVYKSIQESDITGNDSYFLMLKGKVDRRNGELQFIASSVEKSSIQSMRENALEQGIFDPNESQFADISETHDEDEVDIVNATPSDKTLLTFQLKDFVTVDDLKKIKTILQKHPGDKHAILNVIVEGLRQNIETGILVEDSPELHKDIQSYLVTDL